MFFIRPIERRDLNALFDMAEESGIGVTSLPANHDKMELKISRAVNSFTDNIAQKDALYLFVLEDAETGALAGVSAIEAEIGNQDVWYNYRVGNSVHASQELGVHKQTKTLFLSNDMTGATEVCTLFLREKYRQGVNGRFLSKQRYLFLAEFQERFNERVIAEMRGYSDEVGHSPFWEGLGRKFFQMEFKEADYLTGLGNKWFIAELMPKYPIYVPFLSQEAQEVIGKVHENTEPALALLQQEGFRFNSYIDIFDAGPSVECRLPDIRAVKESVVVDWVADENSVAIDDPRGDVWMISNRQFVNYRVILIAGANIKDGHIVLNAAEIAALSLEPNSQVRAVSMRPAIPTIRSSK
jgi:arginine N-succinyltransferase